MATYYTGGVVPLSIEVRDNTNTLVDPTTIVLTITLPDGTTTQPTLTHDGTGEYSVDYSPGATTGHFTYVWTTTGTVAQQAFGWFDVISGQVAVSSTTFQEIIDEVLGILHGYTSDLEELTSLTGSITSTATTFIVDDSTQVSRGLIEIDSELLWVKSVDQASNTVTIAPFGRGFRDTDAASHSANAMVMNNPRFPRQSVITAVKQTLLSVYPDIFQVLTDESNTSNPVQRTYSLPNNCDLVVEVQWKTIGPSKMWERIRAWKFDPKADTTVFPTGKSIDILNDMFPGRTIKVTYIAPLGEFCNETDTLGLVGLADTARDVLVFGACYRLLASLESSRLQTQSIEQSERSQLVPPGSADSASKYYFGLYSQALQREALRLQKFYPTTSHQVR